MDGRQRSIMSEKIKLVLKVLKEDKTNLIFCPITSSIDDLYVLCVFCVLKWLDFNAKIVKICYLKRKRRKPNERPQL